MDLLRNVGRIDCALLMDGLWVCVGRGDFGFYLGGGLYTMDMGGDFSLYWRCEMHIANWGMEIDIGGGVLLYPFSL